MIKKIDFTKVLIAVLIILFPFYFACIQMLNPIYTDDDIVKEDRLIGMWKSKDKNLDDAEMHIRKKGDVYQYSDDGKFSDDKVIEVVPSKTKEQLYLSFNIDYDKEQLEELKRSIGKTTAHNGADKKQDTSNATLCFTVMKVLKLTDDELDIIPWDQDYILKQLEIKKFELKYFELNEKKKELSSNFVIAEESKKLQEWLIKNDKELFSKEKLNKLKKIKK